MEPDEPGPDDRVVMVCAREDMLHTEDSVLVEGACGHKVWLSASAQKHKEKVPQAEPICIHCVPRDLVQNHEIREVPGALKSLEPIIGQAAADAFRVALMAHNERVREMKTDG